MIALLLSLIFDLFNLLGVRVSYVGQLLQMELAVHFKLNFDLVDCVLALVVHLVDAQFERLVLLFDVVLVAVLELVNLNLVRLLNSLQLMSMV